MKTQALLLTVVVLAILAAVPLAQGQGLTPGRKATPWPCCDNCSGCTRSLPPQCLCRDTSFSGCHPACKKCDKFTDGAGATLFMCGDRIFNYCQRRCTPAA